MFELLAGSKNVQNDCVVLLEVLTFTPPPMNAKVLKIS